MEVIKFEKSKCLCDNCDNIAVKVIDMDKIRENRLWLCKECNNELIKTLKK